MPTTAFEGFKQGGNIIPVKDATARNEIKAKVSWNDAGKSVKKNLCPAHSQTIVSGSHSFVFIADEDGYVSCAQSDGRDWSYEKSNEFIKLKAGTYKARVFVKTEKTDGYVGFVIADSSNNRVLDRASQAGWDSIVANDQTFTLNSDTVIGVEFKVGNGSYAVEIVKENVPTTPYEPYIPDNTELMTWEANGVLGAKNRFYTSDIVSGSDRITIDGSEIRIHSATAGSWLSSAFRINVKPNKNYKCTVNVAHTNGVGAISIRNKLTDYTILAERTNITEDTPVKLSFNSGSNNSIIIVLFITADTSEIGDINFNNMMIYDSADTDPTYVPYAMTNKELTENILTKLFSNPVKLTSADDLDDITTAGIYSIETSVPTNAPSGMTNTYACLIVVQSGIVNALSQIYMQGVWRDSNKHIALRGYGGNPAAWSTWRYITDATT